MRSRPELFDENAARCAARAANTALPELGRLYLDLAAQWREMASLVRLLDHSPAEIAAHEPDERGNNSPTGQP